MNGVVREALDGDAVAIGEDGLVTGVVTAVGLGVVTAVGVGVARRELLKKDRSEALRRPKSRVKGGIGVGIGSLIVLGSIGIG